MSQPSRHSVSVSGVVVNDDGRVLVVQRRETGRWEIPGGVLELDEFIHDGLRREVREETGVEITPGPITGVYKNMKVGVIALVFRRPTLAESQGQRTSQPRSLGGRRTKCATRWSQPSPSEYSTHWTAAPSTSAPGSSL